MYWLFGGSPKTVPGFVAGAVIGGLVASVATRVDRPLLAICMIFSGMVGESIHHYFRTKS